MLHSFVTSFILRDCCCVITGTETRSRSLNVPTFYPELILLPRLCFQEDCLEKVINDTECLFKSREKEYQETIDQIEVRHLLHM